jgi:hypothetical protein
VVQVEIEELLYGTGTGHFAGFFSTSGILRHNVAGATDTTALAALVDRAAECSEPTVGEFTGDGIMVVLGGRP